MDSRKARKLLRTIIEERGVQETIQLLAIELVAKIVIPGQALKERQWLWLKGEFSEALRSNKVCPPVSLTKRDASIQTE